jgi:hypothetical protein
MEEIYPSLTMRNKMIDHKDMNTHLCNALLLFGLLTLLQFMCIKEPRRIIRRVPSSPILKV